MKTDPFEFNPSSTVSDQIKGDPRIMLEIIHAQSEINKELKKINSDLRYSRGSGGMVFPAKQVINSYGELLESGSEGISFRDYLAAKVMEAELISSGSISKSANTLIEAAEKNGQTAEQRIARNSYALADAMISERSK